MTEIEGAVSSPIEGQASAPVPSPEPASVATPDAPPPSAPRERKGSKLDSIIDAAINDAVPEEKKPQSRKSDQAAEGKSKAGEADAGKPAADDKSKAAEAPADLKYPGQWDATTREAVSKLDPETQKLVVKLAKDAEATLTRKTQEIAKFAPDLEFAKTVKGIITPEHKAQLQAAGLDEAGGIQRLLEYQDVALKQPKGYARWFLQKAGLDPRDVFPELAGGQPAQPASQPGQQPPSPAAAPQPQPGPDPHYAKLLGTVDNIQAWIQQEQEERDRRGLAQSASEVTRFREAKDADGNPLRPYFDRVESQIEHLLLNAPEIVEMKATDPGGALQRAYETAVMLDPELRQSAIDAEVQKRAAAQRRSSDIEKARAARSPVSAPAQRPSDAAIKNRPASEHVSRAMEKLGLS